MSAAPGTRQPSDDSVLKTTTWGARLVLLALIALLAAGLSFADGNKRKVSSDLDALKGGHGGATVDVIIQFNQTPTEAHHQKVQSKGGALKTKLDFITQMPAVIRHRASFTARALCPVMPPPMTLLATERTLPESSRGTPTLPRRPTIQAFIAASRRKQKSSISARWILPVRAQIVR